MDQIIWKRQVWLNTAWYLIRKLQRGVLILDFAYYLGREAL